MPGNTCGMTGRAGLPMAVLLLAGSEALSQQIAVGEVTAIWSFVEVIAGTNTPVANPNGALEPGEGARLVLSLAYSPPAGTLVNYSPPPGTGVGAVAGLASAAYDLVAITPGWEGTWSHVGRRSGWGIGSPGSPGWNGNGIEQLQAGQFPLPGTVASAENPVALIWSAVWTPAEYTARSMVFQSRNAIHGGSGLYIHYDDDPLSGHPMYVYARTLATHHGSVEVPVVPAPGPAALVLMAIGTGARRRRPGVRIRR
jgi:hypothetical protein